MQIRFTAAKLSKCGVISGPYFPVFGLNTGKCEPEITPYLDTFHTVFFHREELDETRRLWSNHFIRKSRNAECLGAWPDVLFYTPFLLGRRDCRSPFVEADVNLTLPYCETPQLFGSSDDIVDFAALIMNERNITMPRTPHQAKELFITLLQHFGSVLNVFLYKFILAC